MPRRTRQRSARLDLPSHATQRCAPDMAPKQPDLPSEKEPSAPRRPPRCRFGRVGSFSVDPPRAGAHERTSRLSTFRRRLVGGASETGADCDRATSEAPEVANSIARRGEARKVGRPQHAVGVRSIRPRPRPAKLRGRDAPGHATRRCPSPGTHRAYVVKFNGRKRRSYAMARPAVS